MAYIYQIKNDINEKIYIGKTEFSLEKRFKEHCHDAFRSGKESRPLYAAMRKYGIEHFHISLIEETNNPEEREKYWIEKLGSFKYGYNATIGGDGTKYIDYELVIKTYNECGLKNKTAELLHISPDSVSHIIQEYAPEINNNALQTARIAYGKPVLKLDKNTDEILAVYSSMSEAEENNHIKHHISAVCAGKRKTAGGYKWKYLD